MVNPGHRLMEFPIPEDGKVLSLINRFYRNQDGATATEYAMLVVFIALAVAAGAQTLGAALSGLLTNVASTLTNVTIPTP